MYFSRPKTAFLLFKASLKYLATFVKCFGYEEFKTAQNLYKLDHVWKCLANNLNLKYL